MKKLQIALKVILALTFLSFSFVDLDPGYITAFGYGSMCASIKGFPEKDKYDASQFDYKGGKFYVKAGGRIDLRTILPEGKTYGDLLSEFKKSNSGMYKDVLNEQQYVKIFTSHGVDGRQYQFDPWPSNPSEIVNNDGMLLTFSLKSNESLGKNTSGVKWDDAASQLKTKVGTWLEFARPGWQLYILETVGWSRDCPEKKYWSYDQNDWVTPMCYEYAPPHAYCIVEVK